MITTGGFDRESRSRIQPSRLMLNLGALLFILISLQGLVTGATTGRKTVQTAASLNPTKSTQRPTVMEPAFQNAGKTAGLEIWRIEDFKPVPFPKNEYGKFYMGDSYIILFTKEKNGQFSWDIHFWLGSQSSQDESGTAAILTVQLDELLGGSPVQYREVQEHESQLFLSYFKSGIRYLPGGVSSGFTHVDRNAFEKRLFHVKGKRNIRVKQVDISIASMNKGDCFILDVGQDIYVFVGAKSKRVERLKAISAANQVRDQDHAGRSRIHIVDEFSSERDVQDFFTKLGSGSLHDVPDESAGGDDEGFERNEEQTVNLYRITDSSGSLQIQQVGQKPLQQSLLDTNDCFVLDGASNLYVWVGKKCNNKERSEAMSKAQNFLTTKNYPSWTQIQRIVEGAETSLFKQYFQSWRDAGQSHPRLIRSAGDTKTTRLEQKSGGEAPEFMPDNGSGTVQIFRVENFELAPVAPENYGKFFGGDSYLVKYNYGSQWIIYIWQGNRSSLDEKGASAIHAVTMDNEIGGKAVLIRVVQDHEPRHFLNIFKGKLITFLGGHASGFKNVKDRDDYVEGELRLYRIRGTNAENVRASQLKASASSLASDDVFIAENDQTTWLWIGKDSDKIEQDLANNFIELLAPNTNAVIVKEGQEPDNFWKALGGKKDYDSSFETKLSSVEEPRLFHAQIRSNGLFSSEEIHDFEQEDLVEDDVMILDLGTNIFVWIGNGATEDERRASFKLAQQYARKQNRKTVAVITVKQNNEPKAFTSIFSSWDPNFWNSLPSYDAIKSKLNDRV